MKSQNRPFVWWLFLVWAVLVCVFGGVMLLRWLGGNLPRFLSWGNLPEMVITSIILLLFGYVLVASGAAAATMLFPSWRGLGKYEWLFRGHFPGTGKGHELVELGITLFWVTSLLIVLSGSYKMASDRLFYLAMGISMMVTGNYLSRATPKDHFTTRTKWTQADPEVWRCTHRFAGRLWFALGLLACVLTLSPIPRVALPLFVAVGVIAVRVLPGPYARRIYLRLHPERYPRGFPVKGRRKGSTLSG